MNLQNTVFAADYKVLSGSGAPDRAKGARKAKLKIPTLKGAKAAPKMSTKTTKLASARVKKGGY